MKITSFNAFPTLIDTCDDKIPDRKIHALCQPPVSEFTSQKWV